MPIEEENGTSAGHEGPDRIDDQKTSRVASLCITRARSSIARCKNKSFSFFLFPSLSQFGRWERLNSMNSWAVVNCFLSFPFGSWADKMTELGFVSFTYYQLSNYSFSWANRKNVALEVDSIPIVNSLHSPASWTFSFHLVHHQRKRVESRKLHAGWSDIYFLLNNI